MPAVTDAAAEAALVALLTDPAARRDPYPTYRLLQSQAPVLRSSFGMLVVSRYADGVEALRNPRLGRGLIGETRRHTPRGALHGLAGDPGLRQEYFDQAANNMLFADPPDHTRLRRLVSRAFTPRRVAALRPAIEATVDELLTPLLDAGPVEVMAELAFPLPSAVIAELVGVPQSDRAGFQGLVRASAAGIEPVIDDATVRAAMAAGQELRAYFVDLLAERRRRPAEDLLTALDRARDDDDALSDDEIVSTAVLLFAAGFETTTNLIGNGLLALLRHPQQLDRLRCSPDVAPSAVEELLRWDSPVQINSRSALEAATVAGEALEPGQTVMVLQGAANRDPQRFERPDVLDIGRGGNVPLSFGWGAHHCIGAPLARLEGEIVFRALAGRTIAIDLLDEEPAWRSGITLRGLEALPVSLRSS
ncbi:cytochrome P450 [Acidiferrimicrobium sp. IK]|uniref:cytochrome P450 n=1 Tax=Acidiferrimicrobium sp. IK TaxID=2871700 RepID=UPI0021CB2C5D|nr:cytochrome P450 [Acidiferrimicrobium sp. IK]MCU4184546.1 cytochrome P450 [Acidiferrimicrobium sp. IK]